jgi:hypothetical protein
MYLGIKAFPLNRIKVIPIRENKRRESSEPIRGSRMKPVTMPPKRFPATLKK